MKQEKIRSRVSSFRGLCKALAEHVKGLREDAREVKKKIDERYSAQIDESLELYEKYSKEIQSFQMRCRNKFHRDKSQLGRCPDCHTFRGSP